MSDKQLPKLELRTNIAERLGFPYGDAKYLPSKKEGWAPQYLLTVENDEGQMMAWFATETVFNKLLEAGVGKGGIADVTKGEVKGADGKMRVEWIIDVIDPGMPVANPVRGGPTPAQAGATGPAAFAGAPGTRTGAEGRLGELGAAYAACIDQAKGVWLRSGQGIAGKLDHETIHSTASVFMIALQRDGFDLAVFANTYGESEGLRALRRLIERTHVEPHLVDVRDHFGSQLNSVPLDAQEQRRLYASLRAAITTATQIAAENTPAPTAPDDDELPFETKDIGPIPDTGAPPKITGGAKPAAKPAAPAWLADVTGKAKRLWGDAAEGKLAELIVRVTRESRAPVDLSDAQAKTVTIVLDNQLARQPKA
jgi:hypothetical protein